jgi:hypothetical protein
MPSRRPFWRPNAAGAVQFQNAEGQSDPLGWVKVRRLVMFLRHFLALEERVVRVSACFSLGGIADTDLAHFGPKRCAMKTYVPAFFATSVLLLGSGCAEGQPPRSTAANVERMQCDGSASPQAELALLQSTTVLRVEPLYSHVATSNNNSEERVNGAKLVVRPPKGVTADQMTRILQCHSARVLLGQVDSAAVPNDPYWLPDRWLNIDVKPDNGNFAITVSADTVHDNLRVFGRATHYADERAIAVDPALP